MTQEIKDKCTLAKKASFSLAVVDEQTKNNALLRIADALLENADKIIAENKRDVECAIKNGTKEAMIDRLTLTKQRIEDMAQGVRQVLELSDPIGEVVKKWERPNGLIITQKRVPMGVIGIIYEARPNVTVDAAVLCLKTSNAVVLRGGSDAICSNIILMKIMQQAAYESGIPEGSLNLIEDTKRETAIELMRMNGYIDMLIPRGGKGLIQSVVQNATVPVVETAAGNCHIYIDSECDEDIALKVLINAKVSRPSVCNAVETLLVDEEISKRILGKIVDELKKNNVEVRGCQKCIDIVNDINLATEEDWSTEYNDYIISIKIVDGIDEAISHINTFNTKHSESIITNNPKKAERFLNEVDASAVYLNASTRFTDGFEFGFGAEIGISTQKMHARGPMGLEQLTSIKYVIYGNGQIR